MLQLTERQVGCDDHRIGFPSVQTCLAVVVQTTQELLGWHSFNTVMATMVNDMGKFVQSITANARGNPVHFYTATNRKVHGKDWKQELRSLAAALNYHGPATSIDLHVNTEGAYVQFERNASSHTCDVYYKRNSKMDYDFGASKMDVTTVRQKELKAAGPYPYGDPYSATGRKKMYTVVRTNSNSKKGHLNGVSWFRRNTITIP